MKNTDDDSSSVPAIAMTGEGARLGALYELDILDTPPEPHFDRIVRLASDILKTPISMVTLVDEARQWFKARVGVDVTETPRSSSFCAHAIQGDSVMVINDAANDARFTNNPLVIGAPYIRFYAGAPLTLPDGHSVGTLCVIDRIPRNFSRAQQSMLEDLAAIVVDEMELRRANRRLNQLATTDPMTGLLNRRSFFAAAEREVARAVRYGGEVALLILDIDHFKRINDEYGHDTGDHAIIELARTLIGAVRKEVLLCRLGGDEFAACLPETDLAALGPIAERIRLLANNARFDTTTGTAGFRVSIGATIHQAGETVAVSLNRADEALYRSKNGGRDRVTISASAKSPTKSRG